jgi:hypothetical protein
VAEDFPSLTSRTVRPLDKCTHVFWSNVHRRLEFAVLAGVNVALELRPKSCSCRHSCAWACKGSSLAFVRSFGRSRLLLQYWRLVTAGSCEHLAKWHARDGSRWDRRNRFFPQLVFGVELCGGKDEAYLGESSLAFDHRNQTSPIDKSPMPSQSFFLMK